MLALSSTACGGEETSQENGADSDAQQEDTQTSSGSGEEHCSPEANIEETMIPSEKGPWPVGARTLTAGVLTVEAFYPAMMDESIEEVPKEYDIRGALPLSQQDLIPTREAPLQVCDCTDAAPLDRSTGRFPLAIFIHGTAGWRTQSLTLMTRLASWGFVVLAADHPGLWLADILAATPFCFDSPTGQQNLRGDVEMMLVKAKEGLDQWAFLEGQVDFDRITLLGHSAGGSAVAQMTDLTGVQAVVSMAAGEKVIQSEQAVTSVFLGAHLDSVVPYSSTQDAYAQSEGEKYLLGIAGTGHLAFSDICELENTNGDDLITIASEAGVCGTSFAGFLFDCDDDYLDAEKTNQIVSHAVVSVLLETFQCADTQSQLSQMQVQFPEVYEYQDNR